MTIRNIYAFSYALKNQFEIISRNENYAFNHNKNFCRNGNNQSLRGIENAEVIQNRFKYWIASLLSVARNDDSAIASLTLRLAIGGQSHGNARTLCATFGDDGDELFSRNDYGKDFIFGFLNNSNFGFLFNIKINSTKKITSRRTKMKKILFQKKRKKIYNEQRKNKIS